MYLREFLYQVNRLRQQCHPQRQWLPRLLPCGLSDLHQPLTFLRMAGLLHKLPCQ